MCARGFGLVPDTLAAMAHGGVKHAWFRRLGVDVWVRRGAKTAVPTGESEATAELPRAPAPVAPPALNRAQMQPSPRRLQPSPAKLAPSPAKASSSPGTAAVAPPIETFTIRCLRLGEVFAAIAEDAWPRRRFLLDVMRAMNGFRAAKVHSLQFDWPQPGVSATSQPQRAFAAFAGHQMEGEAMRRVVSGARAAAIWGLGEQELHTRAIERGVYVHPGDESAEAKQALWRLVAASKSPSL